MSLKDQILTVGARSSVGSTGPGPADDLVAVLKEARPARAVLAWPGRAIRVGIRQLMTDEVQAARAAAMRYLRDVFAYGYSQEVLADEVITQQLARAMFDPIHEQQRIPPSLLDADDVRRYVTDNERIRLALEYNAIDADAANVELTEELFNDIEQAVKKKDLSHLSSFGAVSLSSYLLTTASRQES